LEDLSSLVDALRRPLLAAARDGGMRLVEA